MARFFPLILGPLVWLAFRSCHADGRVFVLEMQNVSETGHEWARKACAAHSARLASVADLWHAILECSFSVCTRGWMDGATVGTTICKSENGAGLRTVDVKVEDDTLEEEERRLDAFCVKDKGAPCGAPPTFPHTHMQSQTGLELGDELVFGCEAGFSFSSGDTAFSLLCDSCGEWYGHVQLCAKEAHLDYEDKFPDGGNIYSDSEDGASQATERGVEEEEEEEEVENGETQTERHSEGTEGDTAGGEEEEGGETDEKERDDVNAGSVTDPPVSLLSQKHLFWFPSEAFHDDDHVDTHTSDHKHSGAKETDSGVEDTVDQESHSDDHTEQESHTHDHPEEESHSHDHLEEEHHIDDHAEEEHHIDDHAEEEHHIDDHPEEEHHIDDHPEEEHHIDDHAEEEHHIDDHPEEEHHIDDHPEDEHHIDDHAEDEHHIDDHTEEEHHIDDHPEEEPPTDEVLQLTDKSWLDGYPIDEEFTKSTEIGSEEEVKDISKEHEESVTSEEYEKAIDSSEETFKGVIEQPDATEIYPTFFANVSDVTTALPFLHTTTESLNGDGSDSATPSGVGPYDMTLDAMATTVVYGSTGTTIPEFFHHASLPTESNDMTVFVEDITSVPFHVTLSPEDVTDSDDLGSPPALTTVLPDDLITSPSTDVPVLIHDISGVDSDHHNLTKQSAPTEEPCDLDACPSSRSSSLIAIVTVGTIVAVVGLALGAWLYRRRQRKSSHYQFNGTNSHTQNFEMQQTA
ncbi:sushi domain-containing protein 5 isoform X2 [Alosa alosa]|uniref:sushi domain-containing protein 5 isoform X2 n=1 Tax=Alosa alosa TaxID=278164 RepID=UPI00201522A9|nr:sushi domain-containing protein 5 isoform X2 [Alosa alosa]